MSDDPEHLCPVCLDAPDDVFAGDDPPWMCHACGQCVCGGCWPALKASDHGKHCPTCRAQTRVSDAYCVEQMEKLMTIREPGKHTGHALFVIGSMCVKGSGVPQDSKKGIRLWEQSAAGGNAHAEYNLGYCYHNGRFGVEQDHEEAVRLYRIAAAQGHPAAQSALGIMYGQGHGVVQDFAAARQWFTLAAEQGSSAAFHDLGMFHARGLGGAVDHAAAALWLKRAADKGNSLSIEILPSILHLLFPPGTPIELVEMPAEMLNVARGVVLGTPGDRSRVGKLVIRIGGGRTRKVSFENLRRVGAASAPI
jgi:hypothetical protein